MRMDNDKDVLVIRPKLHLSEEDLDKILIAVREQMATGVVLFSECFDVYVVRGGCDVQMQQLVEAERERKHKARLATLERMRKCEYISKSAEETEKEKEND